MLFRISTVVVALQIASTAGQCFLPDGSKDDNDEPCFSNDSNSRCCAPDEFCSTNKLCVLKTGGPRFARGSCLDKDYGSSCPTFCKGINDKEKVDLFQCGDPSLGTFCCDEGNGNSCCATPSKVLTLGVGTTFTEGSAESTIMSSMSKVPKKSESTTSKTSTSTTSKTSTSTSEVKPSTTVQTETSVQVQTTVQTQTSVEAKTSIQTQTSLQVQTSFQVQTSAEVITSIQTQTSAQVVTSIQVQTSVIVVTSVAGQTSIQTQAPSSNSPISMATTPSSSPTPSTSLLPLPPSTSILQPSTSIFSTSAAPMFSATAESIVQNSPASTPPLSRTSSAITPPALSASDTTSPSKDPSSVPASITSAIITGAISATNNPTTSGGVSTAAIISGSVGGVIVLTILIIAGVIFYKRRAEKRASARFEASLGKTNFTDEKGSIRSGKSGNGFYGPALGKFKSNISPPIANRTANPDGTIGGTTIQATERSITPVELPSDRNPYPRNSRVTRSSFGSGGGGQARGNAPEPGVQRRFTGDSDSNSAFISPVTANSPNKAMIPLPGLEKRVSGGTFDAAPKAENNQRPGFPEVGATFRSETFDKLLYDVQSQPF
ncbi:uncharacterized protein PAC_00877 [Phialocephala subalpina]|uniref:Mid2 domain-containing protein n=1 Tax=Phialocephala subalpina TaxID=576137 RepID=A0A1L7WDZ0_9HELO|nr:uncharacterized protein PAC_00877 [Phialocephala subalpina]